jgi:phosphoglycolate phosphatase
MTGSSSNPFAGAVLAFDLDGTLVETAPDLIGTLNMVLVEEGLPQFDLSVARHLIGQGARAMLRRGFAEAGRTLSDEEAAPLVDRFIELYYDRIADESYAYPGVIDALDHLSGQGARLVVCTNKLTRLSRHLLDKLDMSRRFEAIIGADLAPKAKPDPSHVLHAVQAAGGTPDRAIMVGDSMNDVASAQAAGVATIVVPFGYTEIPAAELGADILISHYNELVDAAFLLLQRGSASAIGSRS